MVQSERAGSPLSADSLCTFMAASLPKGTDHQLKNAYEAVALATHAGMIAVGFRLIGLGEDHHIEATADAENPQPLPTEWNASNSYAFRYAHNQSSMEYLVKINRLGGKAVVFGLAVGDDKTATFDVAVKDYISENSLPVSASQHESTDDLARKLQDVFISAGRLADFGSLLKLSLIQKLAPGISKEGYEDTNTERGSTREPPQRGSSGQPRRPPESDPEPARPYPFDPPGLPLQPGHRFPEPIPGFEDEYEVNGPLRGGLRDGWIPGGLGHDDLNPPGLGPHDPLRPHLGGQLPRPGGMGGMHPTFDDPLFRGQGGQGGQGGYDPMTPPGARFDPIGPGGEPRDNRNSPFSGGRGGGRGGFGGGRPPNPFSSFDDNDFL